MPVLLADTSGRCVGVAHAGWRGLAAGVIQATVHAMRQRLDDADAEMLAYLGPAIGPRHFEVGADVREAMRTQLPDADSAFATARRREVFRRLVRARTSGACASRSRPHLWRRRLHVQRPDAVLQLSSRWSDRAPRGLDLARLTLHTRCGESARGDPNANFHSRPQPDADRAKDLPRRAARLRRDQALHRSSRPLPTRQQMRRRQPTRCRHRPIN